jgi:hypothetical protein
MTAVTQIIPNYLGGVSKQPDEKKQTGQVKDIINGYADPVYGLTKRNGFEFLTTLDECDICGLDNGAWFFINRDSSELYIGCIQTSGIIRIWDIITMKEIPSEDITYIGDTKDYLGNGLNWTDYEFLTVQDATMIVNKTKTVLQDYGLDVNGNYLEHPDKYVPNNVATIKCLSVEYNTDYEIIIKSDFFRVPAIMVTSQPQPTIGSSAKLQTASDILQLLANAIPQEFFDVTVLNTSMELKSKLITEGAIDSTNNIKLYQDETSALYFIEGSGPEVYIKFNAEDVTYFFYGEDWEPAGIVRDGTIQLCWKNIDGNELRISTIADDGSWDGTYTTVDKDPDSTAYWAEEDRFNNDFDDDRFIGDPSNGDNVGLQYTQVCINDETGLTAYQDQYGQIHVGALPNPSPLTGSNSIPYTVVPSGIGNYNDSFYGQTILLTIGTGETIRRNEFSGGTLRSSYNVPLEDGRGNINQNYYDTEDLVYQDLNGDYFIGDPSANPPVPAPPKPIVEIVAGAPFTIEVKAGRDGKALDAYQSEVENAARLAATSVQGRRVKILNTSDDASSYFVKFIANDPDDPIAGNGYWEEDLGWEEYEGNKDVDPYIAVASFGTQLETMPHILKVPEPGKFEFSTYPFTARLVGSEISNPSPGYVDKTINHVFLDNNRLGFLSGENVILSQSGEFENFYYTSAKTTIDSDPIDLNCSSIRPANLHSTVPNAQGLIIFSKFEQFMLASESGTLSPGDAVIRSISNYENDPLVAPVDVGTSTMFITKTPAQTRTMGMVTRGLLENPSVVDISKVITDYVPPDIDTLTSSPQNSFITMSGKDHGNMYFYRFFNNGERDVMQAWFRWTLNGKVQSHFIAQDTLFVILKTDSGYHVVQSPLSQSTSIQERLNLRMDNYFACNDPRLADQELVYDLPSNLTKLPHLYPIPTSGDYVIYNTSRINVNPFTMTVEQLVNRIQYVNPGNDYVGGGYIYPIVIKDGEWFVKGDWTGNDPDGTPWRDKLIIGKLYDFEVQLPSTYFRPAENVSDYTASLTLARYKFSFGESGEVNFYSKARGSEEWNMVGAVPDANYYNADTPAITNETILTVPIYQRNKNFEFKIVADTPLPVSLNSMMWEGKYVPRNYRRA